MGATDKATMFRLIPHRFIVRQFRPDRATFAQAFGRAIRAMEKPSAAVYTRRQRMHPRPARSLLVRKRRPVRALLLYAAAIVNEFRWTLAALGALIAIGAALYATTPNPAFGNQPPDLLTATYGAWMAMLAQPITAPPQPWHLTVLAIVYPVFGFLLIGEGVVRLALLLMSRRHGEKEWMRVMAATYRDHIVLCGLGHLGYRVFEHLVESHIDVVVIEMDENNRFLAQARATLSWFLISYFID
jgi:hypothetical protein